MDISVLFSFFSRNRDLDRRGEWEGDGIIEYIIQDVFYKEVLVEKKVKEYK